MTDSVLQERATVLIVDDQPANLMILSRLLKDDYRVLVANNAAKAMEIAQGDNPPVLILLDIEMPGMDGYDLCRELKEDERTSGIAVIFVTARDAAEDEEMGFRLGAVDYISKPYHPAIVRARVRNHVNLKIRTDMLEKLSNRDGLTNIPNRRYFEERLEGEWARAWRSGQPLSVVMMDIDHFKLFNDHYGHGAGDDCLRRVARILKKSLTRSMDMIARYGGEEFVAILPDTDRDGALHVGEQLREAVEREAIRHEYSPTASTVTISVGIASHTAAGPQKDTGRLLQAADRALYQAKERGRNMVLVSEE